MVYELVNDFEDWTQLAAALKEIGYPYDLG